MRTGAWAYATALLAGAVLALPTAAHAQAGSMTGHADTSQSQAVTSTAGDAAGPTVVADFSNPGLSPAHWTLTVHPDGSGHFSSEMSSPPAGERGELGLPNINRDIHVSPKFAAGLFETAERHALFNQDCESHLKVAFQGWKKLSYTGPQGSGSCTFNYSKDKEIAALGDSLIAVSMTILEGVKLEMLLQHDPLGLDKEMGTLASAAQEGRAQQLCTISDILQRLVQDDHVMEMVRKQARQLLARADS